MYVGAGPDQAVPLVHLQVDLAAHRTMRAYALDLLYRLVPLVVALHQGACGACVYAGAAELAARLQERHAPGSANEVAPRPLGEGQGVVAPDLVADPHAAAAHDAQVEVHLPERVVRPLRQLAVVVRERGVHVHFEEPDRVLELAPFVLRARDAPVVDRHVPEADVRGAAQIDPVAGQTTVGGAPRAACP